MFNWFSDPSKMHLRSSPPASYFAFWQISIHHSWNSSLQRFHASFCQGSSYGEISHYYCASFWWWYWSFCSDSWESSPYQYLYKACLLSYSLHFICLTYLIHSSQYVIESNASVISYKYRVLDIFKNSFHLMIVTYCIHSSASVILCSLVLTASAEVFDPPIITN